MKKKRVDTWQQKFHSFLFFRIVCKEGKGDMTVFVTIPFNEDRKRRDAFYNSICKDCLVKVKCVEKLKVKFWIEYIDERCIIWHYYLRIRNGCKRIKDKIDNLKKDDYDLLNDPKFYLSEKEK